MQNKLLYLFFTVVFSFTLNAQDLMELDNGKKYIATSTWQFFCDAYTFSGILKIQIGKTETGGILKLQIATNNKEQIISERVYVVLKDGTYIYCSDKGNHQNNGTEAISYYRFSSKDMNLLKMQSIDYVRFKINGVKSKFSTPIGFFTATNKKQYFDMPDNSKNKIDTEIEILKLYK